MLNGRSEGAVEFKHQNISAVLQERGLPWINGYKPRENTQGRLEELVDDWLDKNPEFFDANAAAKAKQPIAEPTGPLTVVPPPDVPDQPTIPNKRKYRARKIDFAQRDARNKQLGSLGEQLVVEYEKAALILKGRPDLAARVCCISAIQGDGAGYDVLSFEVDGNEKFIEAKTTTNMPTKEMALLDYRQ